MTIDLANEIEFVEHRANGSTDKYANYDGAEAIDFACFELLAIFKWLRLYQDERLGAFLDDCESDDYVLSRDFHQANEYVARAIGILSKHHSL